MPKLIDLTSLKFGKLSVMVRLSNNQYGSSQWLCQCNCGKETVVLGCDLTGNKTKSCGCLRIQHGHNTALKKSKIYIVWGHIIQRCTNLNDKDYHNYGGRRIAVCHRWRKFKNFLIDMGEPPTKQHSIDRINNNGNYCKSNCRWATPKQQARNRKSNRKLSYHNKTQGIVEWRKETGIREYVIRQRLKHHWSIKRTLTTSVRKQKRFIR